MSELTDLRGDAMAVLMATSRTFFIPITRLSPGLQEAVSAAYLCMRAIDEIEDHSQLPSDVKSSLLYSVSKLLQKDFTRTDLTTLLRPYESVLPEVSLRLYDWVELCPKETVEKVKKATSVMAKGMAEWVEKNWDIRTEDDLNDYTYYVAGLVGVMLSDLWEWYDGTKTDKNLAVAFGRGLQSVNILRNREEDQERGVSFFPDGWELEDMFKYARANLALADAYIEDINKGHIYEFCKIPLALAHGTLNTLEKGREKLTRNDVLDIVSQVVDK
ncbi:squalene/phytoene synthase family protein [Anaerobacillus sp. MEB173]|uniref:squalene/phytoene synthase family protein n=1 Tax=Anaerobacillus sp. MEB173 TaxID=3383345 RepID=UPI003F92E88D